MPHAWKRAIASALLLFHLPLTTTSASATDSMRQKVFRDGPLTVVMRYREAADGGFEAAPLVSVRLAGREVARVELKDAWYLPKVAFAELDSANAHPEVVVQAYTGGAHCCTDVWVFTTLPDGSWKVLRLGAFDGGNVEWRDLDGDDQAEFMLRDDRFLYRFSSYAGSYSPPLVLAVRGGKTVNLTRQPAMRRFLRQEERRIRKRLRAPDIMEINGTLAGYVALKQLLGEGREAWFMMLRRYDRAESRTICPIPTGDYQCAVSELPVPFPLDLALFLRETGYVKDD